MRWDRYKSEGFFDELVGVDGAPRPESKGLLDYLSSLDQDEVKIRIEAAETQIRSMGISFTVYSDAGNIDRNWPFDIIPRTIDALTWNKAQEGLTQRLRALNLFIEDLYNDQKIVKDGVVPAHIFHDSRNFLEPCKGKRLPYSAWAHICGTDLVRDDKGDFYVLEDNLRVPSGVAYMLENRHLTKRVFPELFQSERIRPVDDYCARLFETLASLSPRQDVRPNICVLTPGIYNSAYFEHAYLAQQIGGTLVEGADLVVDEHDKVFMKTIEGLKQVDVIYRRIDDIFMDPEVFRKDSILGVPGLMRAWHKGTVAIANAPGSGVADDKVVYAYVPKIIEYYLSESPKIPNVETYICDDPKERSFVLANLDKLVVKPANESGGYGMLIGPHSTKEEQATFADLIKDNPRNYIAQPTLKLSTAPTFAEGIDPSPRHLDLRPFVLQGEKSYVTTGGLTRVAMRKGSLVVNSSQGGGSKDTWIVETKGGQA